MDSYTAPNPFAIRALRIAYGYSVTSLADAVGCSRAHLSNIEAGRRDCSPTMARAIAETLSVPLGAIVPPERKVAA